MSRRRRTAAARTRARQAAERAMLAAWDHPAGTGRASSPEVHVHRLLDAIEAAGVEFTQARPVTLVDGAARTALDALETALGELAEELSFQEQAAAAGPGTLASDIRARLSDPTPGRLTEHGAPVRIAEGLARVQVDQADPRGPDGTRYGDEGQLRRLREAKIAVVEGLGDWARWLTRQTWGYGHPCEACGRVRAAKHFTCYWPASQCPHKQAAAHPKSRAATG